MTNCRKERHERVKSIWFDERVSKAFS